MDGEPGMMRLSNDSKVEAAAGTIVCTSPGGLVSLAGKPVFMRVLNTVSRLAGWFVALVAAAVCPGLPVGAQVFKQPLVVPTGNWPAAVYSSDVNGDGVPDLVYIDQGATATSSTTHVLLGNGHGGFTQSATVATAGNSVAVGNLTGHGRVDLGWLTSTSGNPTSNATLWVAAGNGDGTYAAAQSSGAAHYSDHGDS